MTSWPATPAISVRGALPHTAAHRRVRPAHPLPGVQADADPLGCLGDVGWYNLRTIMFANGWELPTYVSAHALDVNDEGVPLTMAGVVGYESSISTFDIGFDAPRAKCLCGHHAS